MSTISDTARADLVRAIVASHADERGALLPVLHEVNDELGYIAREDVATIAGELNLSVAEVHGVVSFYHDFRTSPPAAHRLTLCRAEACQAVGAAELFADTVARAADLGTDVEVAEVFCLGNCALGPSGTMDGRLHGRLTPERVAALTGDWR